MKVESIFKKEIYYMTVDGVEYTRHNNECWTYVMSWDIHSEDYDVSPDMAKDLEKLFQEYKDLAD